LLGLVDLILLAPLLLEFLLFLLADDAIVLPTFGAEYVGRLSFVLDLSLLERLGSIVVTDSRLQVPVLQNFQSLRIFLLLLLEQQFDLQGFLLYLVLLLPTLVVVYRAIAHPFLLDAQGGNPTLEHVDVRLLLGEEGNSV
jgi:hypothetical protein